MSESLTSKVFPRGSDDSYLVYRTIKDSQELKSTLAEPYPVVLMFLADWNEPSRVMKKPFRDMALAKRKHAIFCKLDVDKFKGIVEQYRVEALPTFVLMENGKEKGRVVGAKELVVTTSLEFCLDMSATSHQRHERNGVIKRLILETLNTRLEKNNNNNK
ncbi:hypothetical protein ZWY2020_026253 [Hordeum vulgare]|nr:hypothetical protein ZWY2020_026253 [Hordeum vulgare]